MSKLIRLTGHNKKYKSNLTCPDLVFWYIYDILSFGQNRRRNGSLQDKLKTFKLKNLRENNII